MWLKNISDKDSFPGIKIYETILLKSGSAITLPGIGIFIHTELNGIFKIRMLQHEYGHYLDYLSVSTNRFYRIIKFYFFIGLPSFINAAIGIGGHHRIFWTEIRANRFAEIWFGNKLAEGYKKFYPTQI